MSGNAAYEGDGIFGNNASTIQGNVTDNNGGDGVRTGVGALVRDNTVSFNDAFGLNLSATAAYGANVVTFNGAGTVSGGAKVLLNQCNGLNAPACP